MSREVVILASLVRYLNARTTIFDNRATRLCIVDQWLVNVAVPMGCGIDGGGSSSSSSSSSSSYDGGRRTVGKVKLRSLIYSVKLNDRVFINVIETASGHSGQDWDQIGVVVFLRYRSVCNRLKVCNFSHLYCHLPVIMIRC